MTVISNQEQSNANANWAALRCRYVIPIHI